jgi:hypothetical protein
MWFEPGQPNAALLGDLESILYYGRATFSGVYIDGRGLVSDSIYIYMHP